MTTAATATMMPTWMVVLPKRGSRSLRGTESVWGTLVSALRQGPLMSRLARLIPMKLIITEVMISFTPNQALRYAGRMVQTPPTTKPASPNTTSPAGRDMLPMTAGPNPATTAAASRN